MKIILCTLLIDVDVILLYIKNNNNNELYHKIRYKIL